MRIAWTRLAIEDIDSLHDYIAVERPSSAGGVLARIKKSVDRLVRHPDMGRPGRVDGTRELVIPQTSFIAAYRIKAGRLEVLAVIHGACRWPDSF